MGKLKNVQNFDYKATKEFLKAIGIKHNDLADQLGMKYGTLNHILNGYRAPSPELLQKLAELLQIDSTDLLKK